MNWNFLKPMQVSGQAGLFAGALSYLAVQIAQAQWHVVVSQEGQAAIYIVISTLVQHFIEDPVDVKA